MKISNWLHRKSLAILVCLSLIVLGNYLYQTLQTSQQKGIPRKNLEKAEVLAACFAKGTKVLMAGFAKKNIEDVKLGDVVLTRESEKSSKLVEAKVIKVFAPHPSDYLIINQKLKLTEGHVIFASGKWIYAKDLRIGDYMLDPDNNKIKITSIEKSKETVNVYNLEVEHYRTFFANGFYVHNLKAEQKWWFFVLKDSNTNQYIHDATVIMLTRSPYYSSCQFTGLPPWQFSYRSAYPEQGYSMACVLNSGQSSPSQATVSISKSGYQTETATIKYPPLGTVYIPLDKQAPSAPSNLSTTNVTSTSITLAWNASTDNKGVAGYRVYRNNVQVATSSKTTFVDSGLKSATNYSYNVRAYDAAGNLSAASNTIQVSTAPTIKNVVLPNVFTQADVATTNLAAIEDPAKVADFTLEVAGKNKIVWTEHLDLSSQETIDKLKSLDNFINAATPGIVEVDSAALPQLNKKATITMYNLPFISTPKILVDGVENYFLVSQINYKNGTLSFQAAHFTKFEAAPTLEISEPVPNFTIDKSKITLNGKISDPAAKVLAKLNDKDLGELKVATDSGEFSTKLSLKGGKNTITVSAISNFGPPIFATASGTLKTTWVSSYLLWFVIAAISLAIMTGAWWFFKKKSKEGITRKQIENENLSSNNS